MELPIARLGDKCVSPAGLSGTITTASTDFFADGRGVARVGDTVTYSNGTTTTCAQGDPFVTDGPRPIVRQTYVLADGGKVVQGSPRATSGSPTPGAGSVAERTLVAARQGGYAFVPVDCEQRGTVDEPPAPDEDLPTPAIPLDSDLPDGGAPALHAVPTAAADSTSSSALA